MAAMNTMTPASSGVRLNMKSCRLVEFVVMTRITKMRASGARAGESVALTRPRVAWLSAVAASAGSAIMTSMSKNMPAASTCTVAPTRSLRVAGMVTGELSVEMSSVPRASDMSPA